MTDTCTKGKRESTSILDEPAQKRQCLSSVDEVVEGDIVTIVAEKKILPSLKIIGKYVGDNLFEGKWHNPEPKDNICLVYEPEAGLPLLFTHDMSFKRQHFLQDHNVPKVGPRFYSLVTNLTSISFDLDPQGDSCEIDFHVCQLEFGNILTAGGPTISCRPMRTRKTLGNLFGSYYLGKRHLERVEFNHHNNDGTKMTILEDLSAIFPELKPGVELTGLSCARDFSWLLIECEFGSFELSLRSYTLE